jgi:predicted small lipoprotein YifL
MKTINVLRTLHGAVAMSILLMFSACGLKGDLYIPAKAASPESTTADSSDEPETESELPEEQGVD